MLASHTAPHGFEVLEVVVSGSGSTALCPPPGTAQFSVVLDGEIRASKTIAVVGSGLLFTTPDWPHPIVVTRGPAHVLVIRPDAARFELYQSHFSRPWPEIVVDLVTLGGLPHRIIHTLQTPSPSKALQLEAALVAVIAVVAEAQGRRGRDPLPSAPVHQATRFIQANLDQPIGLQEVADAVQVSRSKLAETFRREKGLTIGDYIRAARVERACRRLRDTRETLNEIALACGFCDQSHMARVFREELDITPLAYRRLMSANEW